MASALFSSVFGDLVKNIQIRFDQVSALQKQWFDQVLFEKYLSWDAMTSVKLDFEEIIGKYNITIAAPTIGNNSKESIVGNNGVETLREKLVNHAITIPLTMEDYRKVLEIRSTNLLTPQQQKDQLINLMFGNVTDAVNGVRAKLDLIFLSALSNEGKFEFNADTNPEGIRGSIDYNQPAANIATATTPWTEANKDTVDPLEDILAMCDAAQDKVVLAKILLSPAKLNYILRAKKTRQMMWGTDKAMRMVNLQDYNAYLQQNGLPILEPVRRQIRVQDNGIIKTITPFNGKNIVAIPDGSLGVVKNAFANNELSPEPTVGYANYGRIRVSQWSVGEAQGSNKVEYTKAECYALPVITEMQGIYTLKTES